MITYDAIGNPLTYRDGMTMTWKNGRQLSTLHTGDSSISYGYDSSSVRISKTVKIFKGIGNSIAIASVAIDAGTGIYDNIQAGAAWNKVSSDAAVDLVVSGGSVLAAGAAGSAIGNVIGTICPGLGNIIGAGAGFIFGVAIYVFTDVIPYNGKTARDWAKEGVNNLW